MNFVNLNQTFPKDIRDQNNNSGVIKTQIQLRHMNLVMVTMLYNIPTETDFIISIKL